MFKFRFATVLQLRENERGVARAAMAEAYAALRQVEARRDELVAERSLLDSDSLQRRSGTLSVDRLLSDGRYERQLAADLTQLKATAEKIEAEITRRQTMLTEANAAVRQMELLKEKEQLAWNELQAKISQANLDEIAGRGTRGKHPLLSMACNVDVVDKEGVQ